VIVTDAVSLTVSGIADPHYPLPVLTDFLGGINEFFTLNVVNS
jgi:hypothetical protein